MRITIVQGAFLPVPARLGGAVEKIWHALGREFARRGHRVVHVSRRWGDLPARETDDVGVEHRRVSGFDTPRSLALLKGLDAFYTLRAVQVLPPADILVSNTFWLPLFARRPDRGRLYVHVARFPKGQLRFYTRAARLQAVSGPVADAVRLQAPALADRVCVVPNPLPDLPANLAGSSAPREPVILYAGRIHPEKGLGLLVDAFARFLRHADAAGGDNAGASWRLRLVGPWEARAGGGGEGYRRELAARASALGVGNERVEWIGPVFEPGALAAHLRRAALFVYPSLAERGESFGVAPLEAMAEGCPTLVSALACFGDFLTDGKTGFVFNHRGVDPAETLAGALRRLLLDPAAASARERVARAGQEKSREFSVSRVADAFLADFEAVRLLSPGSASLPAA